MSNLRIIGFIVGIFGLFMLMLVMQAYVFGWKDLSEQKKSKKSIFLKFCLAKTTFNRSL